MVTVAGDRKIYINDYAVDLDSLGPKLSAIYRNQQGHQGVFLRADESIPYGFVVKVMAIIRGNGIDDRHGDGTAETNPKMTVRQIPAAPQ